MDPTTVKVILVLLAALAFSVFVLWLNTRVQRMLRNVEQLQARFTNLEAAVQDALKRGSETERRD